jgi:acetyl-CoA carboxylase biotin carboxylase subunit
MNRALDMFVIEGIETTIPLQRRIISHPDFIDGQFGTSFLESLPAL